MSRIQYSVLFVLLTATPCFAQQALRVDYQGKQKTMFVAGYSKDVVLGIRQDGYMEQLDPKKVKNPVVLPRFQPHSQAAVRGQLLKEFGKGFDVSGTGSYLIVHPRGAKDLWANRFEQLYRSMTHFFKTRGFPMQRPKFPMVGIVFYSKSQYLRYCGKVLKENMSGTYGMYSPRTNRIYLYDATQGRGKQSSAFEENMATVMHEAAHQTAFNTGIHVRYAKSPVWVIEGIGCHFEGRGVYNSFSFRKETDRINYGRLRDFKGHVQKDAHRYFASIIASDKPFQRDGARCYAAAWALTYYLSEKEPSKYMRYVRTVAKHEPLEYGYDAAARVKEFTKVFGSDFKMLSVRVSRFIDTLKTPNKA